MSFTLWDYHNPPDALCSELDEGLALCRLVRELWPRHECRDPGDGTLDFFDRRASTNESLPTHLGRFQNVRQVGRGACVDERQSQALIARLEGRGGSMKGAQNRYI